MKLSVSESQHSTVEFIIISQSRHEKDLVLCLLRAKMRAM